MAPLCPSASPWAQGLPSTSCHVPGLQSPPQLMPGLCWTTLWQWLSRGVEGPWQPPSDPAPCTWHYPCVHGSGWEGVKHPDISPAGKQAQLACVRSPSILQKNCQFPGVVSALLPHPLALELGEVPCPLHRAPRERGGEGLVSSGPLCRHQAKSLLEATEGGPWHLEVMGFVFSLRFTLSLFSSFKDEPSHCFFFSS